MLGFFLRRRNDRQFQTRSTWRLRAGLCRDILRVGWPAGVHFGLDVAATRYMHVSFMPAVGIGIACTALVGRYIGLGRPDLARRRAHAAVSVAMAYMGLCGLCFFLFRHPLIAMFTQLQPAAGEAAQAAEMNAKILSIGTTVLICAAVFQCFDAVGIVFVGALRGAGDTFWPMVITFVLAWTMVIGGGAAMIRWMPELGSIGPWIAASVYVIVLGVVMAWRFESGAWRRIDLLGPRPPAGITEPAPVAVPAADGIVDTGRRKHG